MSHCEVLGGHITEADHQLRLSTLGGGGCGFYSPDALTAFAPPKEILCSVFTVNHSGYDESHILQGNVVYVAPVGGAFYYGVRFFEEDQVKLKAAISHLEKLAKKGEIQQV